MMKLMLKYFKEAVKKFPGLFTVAMGIVTLKTVMEAFIPWGLRQYLEQITQSNNYRVLLGGIGLFAVYYAVKGFVKIAWYVSLDKFGGRYIESLSLKLEKSMAETFYGEIEKAQTGVIRNVLYTDVLNVFRVIGHHGPSMVGALGVIAVSLGISFAYERKITLMICIAAAIGFALSWISRKVIAKTAGKTNARLKIHDMWCTQFTEMIPVIQTNNILNYYQQKTSENVKEFINTSIGEDKKTMFWSELVNGYHSIFSIILSAVLAMPLSGNSVANLVFFTMISNLVMEQVKTAETLFQQIIRNYVSFKHIEELRCLPKRNGEQTVDEIKTVEYNSVNFTYNNGVNGLQDINCKMKQGDVIHLIGANGSGKSTFIKLLTGLYKSNSGEILLNSQPIEIYSQQSLNEKILYINQDEKCLNESFLSYIELITHSTIKKEKYHKLLNMVNLSSDERIISENGLSLSAGQRKKLFTLKLLLRFEKASVIILDELTAGLDSTTTHYIYDFLTRLAEEKNKIIIVVDHTVTTEMKFTKIFSFDTGKLNIL